MLLLQEREYKEALEAFNEKNKEKVQLITKLMEVRGKLILIIFFYDEIFDRFELLC